MNIDAIFVSLENRMQLAFEGVGDLTRAHFIAERINSASGITAINLLDEYNTLLRTFGIYLDKEIYTRKAKVPVIYNNSVPASININFYSSDNESKQFA